jgi:hypothetical protein
MSVGQMRRTGEEGRAMAITGIVLGIVGTILVILLVLLFVAFVNGVQSIPGEVIPSPR